MVLLSLGVAHSLVSTLRSCYVPLVHVSSLSQTSHGSQWDLHPGLSIPALAFPSPYPPHALIIVRYCVDSDRPVSASMTLVDGSAGPSIRPAGTFSSSSTSPQPPSLSALSSQDPQASFSYLATLQRFARAAGFSSRFPAPVGLAWHSSSRTFSRLGGLCLVSGPAQHDLVRSFWIETPFGRSVLRNGFSLRCSSFLTHQTLHALPSLFAI